MDFPVDRALGLWNNKNVPGKAGEQFKSIRCEMGKLKLVSVFVLLALILLILFLVSTALLITNCLREPMAEIPLPTPTPLPGGNIFFEPSRISAETRAIEVVIVNLTKQRAPVVEHSIVITEITTLREITATLLAATSTTCTMAWPTPRKRREYGINLYLYNQSEILPLSATSGQWMIASILYLPEENYIGVYRPNGQGDRIIEFCPVGTALREILERELALRGLTLKGRY